MNGETLAKIIVEDLGLPTSYELDISNQVKNSLQAYRKFRNPTTQNNSYYGSKINDYIINPQKKEKYCTILLDIKAEGVHYKDQFEWDIYNKLNSPDEFAKVIVNDLGLPPCFERLINFEISKQVFNFKTYLDKVKTNPMYATYTRQKKYRNYKDNSSMKLGQRVRKEDIIVSNLLRTRDNIDQWTPKINLI